MTMNIGQALLHHAEDGKLRLFGQTRKFLRDFELRFDFTAFGESFDIPTKRGCETYLIEQWRMQQVRNGTNLLTRFRAHRSGFKNAVCCLRTQLMRLRLYQDAVHTDGGK